MWKRRRSHERVEPVSQLCALTMLRDSPISGSTSRIVTSRSWDVTIPFYSALRCLIRSTVSRFDSA